MASASFATDTDLIRATSAGLSEGSCPPPRSEEVLARYAEAFGLEPGSEGWMVFHDLAAAARGEIPRDLMAHGEVLGRLPTIYRELRAELVSASVYELGESFLDEHGE